MANAWACHGSANTGPPSSRGKRGDDAKRAAASLASSGLKVVLPHIDVEGVVRRRGLAPQFVRGKTNQIDMLGLGLTRRVLTVREVEGAATARHLADLAARVARHTRVGGRIDVPSAYPVSPVEPGRQLEVPLLPGGSVEQLARGGSRHHRSRLHRGRLG